MQLGPAEILVILVVALLVFGPTRLPEIGRQVGRGIRELRKIQDTVRRDLDEVLADDTPSGGDPPPTLPPREVEAPAVEPGATEPPATEAHAAEPLRDTRPADGPTDPT